MAENTYNITINTSPSHSNLEIAGDLVIKLSVPYSKDFVTVKVNPNIKEYKEQLTKNKNVEVRHYTYSKDTPETKTLKFGLIGENEQEVNIADKKYILKLMDIRTIREGAQDFFAFHFLVTEN